MHTYAEKDALGPIELKNGKRKGKFAWGRKGKEGRKSKLERFTFPASTGLH